MIDIQAVNFVNLFSVAFTLLVTLILLVVVAVRGRGRARAYGAAGLGLWLLGAFTPLLYGISGLVANGRIENLEVLWAAIHTLDTVLLVAGFVFVVLGLTSRDDGHRPLPAQPGPTVEPYGAGSPRAEMQDPVPALAENPRPADPAAPSLVTSTDDRR